MRVLFIINNLSRGGAERFILDLVSYLHKNNSVDYRLAVLDDLNLYDEYDVETLNMTNIEYTPFSFRKKNKNEKLTQLIDEFKPEIIHTNLFMAEFVTCFDVRKNIRYICHGHDNMYQYTPLTFRQLFDKKRLLNRIDYFFLAFKKYRHIKMTFIANSKHTFEFYSKNVPRKQRNNVHILQYGFNFSQYYKPKEISSDEKIQLVNVGSYQVKKNQKFFIEVAKILKDRGVNFEMNLIGHGELFDSIKEQIERENLTSLIIQRGMQKNVEEWYHKSDLYIHAATYEPFGLVFLEAMAAGLPVVTLDGKGNRDIIVEDKNGYLFLEPDAEKFAEKIIEYTTDKDKYKQISNFGQTYAKQFDAPVKFEELIDFYRSLLVSK